MKTALLAFLIAAGCVCARAQGGTTTVTTTQNYFFPPVGFANGETMAVSLANIAPAPVSPAASAPSCTGTVTFASSTGTIIGKANSFTVGSGQIQTISLAFASAGITANRGEILASVQRTTTRPATAACTLVFSLEVYDSTGETHVYLGNASASAAPTPLGELFPNQ
jgi:hypothetical protein